MTDTTLALLPYDDDQYFAGFGASRLGSYETRGLYVERATSADGQTTITLCRPAAMRAAATRSIAAGGGVRGLSTCHLRDKDPRVILGEDQAARLTVREARVLLSQEAS